MIHFSETKKTFKSYIFKSLTFVLALGLIGLTNSCEEDDSEDSITPTSAFSVSGTNFLEATFVNESANAVSYAWNFGDNSGLVNDANPVHEYAEAGTYTVRLVAVSESDKMDVSSMEVTVIAAEAPTAAFSLVANDLEITFTNESTNGATYAWDFGDESGTSTEENPVYTYAEGGDYTITLTVTSEDGVEDSTSEDITIADGVIPTASFTNVVDFLEVTFTNTSEDATSYSWDFGDSSGTSTDENPVYTYATDGTYEVELTATSVDGIEDVTTTMITVAAPVTPSASFTTSVSGREVTFTNTSTDGATYSWDFGDSSGTSTDENPVYTYATDGIFTVTLTVTSSDDLDDDSSSSVIAFIDPIVGGECEDPNDWDVPSSLDTWLAANITNSGTTFKPGGSSTSITGSSCKLHEIQRRMYQVIPVVSGQTYTITFFAAVENFGGPGTTFGTAYVIPAEFDTDETTAIGTSIASEDIEETATNAEFVEYSVTFTATSNEITFYIVPAGVNVGSNPAKLFEGNDLWIENVSMELIQPAVR
ncbi:PKD domain-containing protein [Aquimarina pacifica]|uniref:PKD domain-containing protein n=1 Tax=Aquimarina pacifica TaxID=1296415 RepID=UPI00047146F9|nr:PKD domain-containing protein [Aquimarina pacifica]